MTFRSRKLLKQEVSQMENVFIFEDEFGRNESYDWGNGCFISVGSLEESSYVSLELHKGENDFRGGISIARASIPKLIRALQACKEELDERMFDEIRNDVQKPKAP